jgi:hypothetical protein
VRSATDLSCAVSLNVHMVDECSATRQTERAWQLPGETAQLHASNESTDSEKCIKSIVLKHE